jgi:hypothetical protein
MLLAPLLRQNAQQNKPEIIAATKNNEVFEIGKTGYTLKNKVFVARFIFIVS